MVTQQGQVVRTPFLIDMFNYLHRFSSKPIRLEDGLVEFTDGSKEYYQNGRVHRDDGPAIEWNFGEKQWWKNGKLHRIDGPAVEWPHGHIEWWVNNRRYSFDNWCEKVNISPEEKTMLMLRYG